MIINSAPQNEAVLSNVGEVGEFRIRNSAKAFNILSSGLYANKIRAIIRELSCNALDSHVAAKNDAPFDLHLPTELEPYFAVRDFGTGLSHDQVTQIYTTYFESTKTNSNDFIGALGLGSKSPFSYTDNFTVTAIKDGTKGIYTAFINDSGVPSIAKMGEEQTDELNGVEIRFAVEGYYDISKFRDEARAVFKWFKNKPNFTGASVTITEMEYEQKDIIPGVHSLSHQYNTQSVAVMGNIAYPIDVPSADKTLGEYAPLLRCGLVMEFGIGELDFQASREGLSYIPQTIQAIKNKLVEVNSRLATLIAEEADKIENAWERSYYLSSRKRSALWGAAVTEYVADTKFELFDDRAYYGTYDKKAFVDDLAKFNVTMRYFTIAAHRDTCHTEKTYQHDTGDRDENGQVIRAHAWSVPVESNTFFVVNDTKVGAFERAKYHWRNRDSRRGTERVFVVEPIDRKQPMKVDELFKYFSNPPETQRIKASDCEQKVREVNKGFGKNVTILRMEERGGSRYRSASNELVWRDGGKASDFVDTQTYYYIPLSGFNPQWTRPTAYNCSSVVQLITQSNIKELQVPVYGIRKGDIETIKKMPNWVNLEQHIVATVAAKKEEIKKSCILEALDKGGIFKYNLAKVVENIHAGLAYDFLKNYVDVPVTNTYQVMREILRRYCDDVIDFSAETALQREQLTEFDKRYPLINRLDYHAKEEDVIGYINLVDNLKGI
jgi:hypothetical protein